MLRSNVNSLGNPRDQSWRETRERKAMVGRICRKGRFKAWNERVRGDEILILIISINVSSITTVSSLRSDHLALAVSVSQPRKSGTLSLHLSMHVPVLIPPSSPTTASRLSSPLNPFFSRLRFGFC